MELFLIIIEACIPVILGIVSKYLIDFIQKKSNEIVLTNDNILTEKYIKILNGLIVKCVLTTNQTFVDSLKDQGKFNKESAALAFEKTYSSVKTLLTDEAIQYLNTIYADLDEYIKIQIESTVKKLKIRENQ